MKLASFVGWLIMTLIAFVALSLSTQNRLLTLLAFQSVMFSFATEVVLLKMMSISCEVVETLTIGLIMCIPTSQVINLANECTRSETTCEMVKK